MFFNGYRPGVNFFVRILRILEILEEALFQKKKLLGNLILTPFRD